MSEMTCQCEKGAIEGGLPKLYIELVGLAGTNVANIGQGRQKEDGTAKRKSRENKFAVNKVINIFCG